MISKKYKWIIFVYHGFSIYLEEKPKKIQGGYMTKNGVKYIGNDVFLQNRETFERNQSNEMHL